jgi:hypothetical protein
LVGFKIILELGFRDRVVCSSFLRIQIDNQEKSGSYHYICSYTHQSKSGGIYTMHAYASLLEVIFCYAKKGAYPSKVVLILAPLK